MRNNLEVAYRPTIEQKPLEQVIADDIRRVRDAFLNREPNEQNAQLTYDPTMDIALYQTLNKYQVTESTACKDAMKSVDSYIHFQLETMLGERFNVLSSEYTLHVTPEGLYSPQGKELMRTILRRGRDYRRKQGSKVTKREDAEVDGFELVTEPILMNPKTKEGTSVVSISPPDGPYRKNFYDVSTVVGEGKNRQIRVRRYSSGLSIKDYKEKIPQTGINYKIPEDSTDAFFLSHPIRIDASSIYSNPDTLHAFFHKTHSYMNRGDFEQIKKACDPLIHSYLSVLRENPYDLSRIAEKFDAILNGADEAKGILEKRKIKDRSIGVPITDPLMDKRIIFTAHDILRFERQKVRPEMTGCGISLGFKKGGESMNPFDKILKTFRPDSVSDFGEDDLGDREFNCPACNYTNTRPYNEKIKLCQNERCPDRTKVAC